MPERSENREHLNHTFFQRKKQKMFETDKRFQVEIKPYQVFSYPVQKYKLSS